MQGNSADAEDALSATKVKAALSYSAQEKVIRNERAWLTRILYTTCMDFHRFRGPAPLTEGEVEVENGMLSVEDVLVGREIRLELGSLIEELPTGWRDAFLKRCWLRRSYSEIAEEAGTTEANIRKRVQLARQYLRGKLVGKKADRPLD